MTGMLGGAEIESRVTASGGDGLRVHTPRPPIVSKARPSSTIETGLCQT